MERFIGLSFFRISWCCMQDKVEMHGSLRAIADGEKGEHKDVCLRNFSYTQKNGVRAVHYVHDLPSPAMETK